MTIQELNKILELHRKWLNGEPHGIRANLSLKDLRGANLRETNLYGAILCGTDLREANLRGANLHDASLCGADLYGADLREADIRGADLCEVDLHEANLYKANFYKANLYEANLRKVYLYKAILYKTNLYKADLYEANLCGTDLRGANLRDASLYKADLHEANLYEADFYKANLCEAKNVPFIPMACPEIGSYVAFKKAEDYFIVVLEIPEDALRSSATTRKCRASKAKVLRIENLDGSISDIQEVCSYYNPTFIYKVGETVEVKNFDTNRWDECSTGIHHFMNRQEAVEYSY